MTEDHVYLKGLALSGYRSFGPTLQFMTPFSKVNVFAGPNNSGKSNILQFIHRHLPKIVLNTKSTNTPRMSDFDPSDDFHRHQTGALTVGLPVPTSIEAIKTLCPNVDQKLIRESVAWLLSALQNIHEHCHAWDFIKINESLLEVKDDDLIAFSAYIRHLDWSNSPLARNGIEEWRFSPQAIFKEPHRIIAHIAKGLSKQNKYLPSVRYIPAFRQLRHTDNNSLKEVSVEGYKGDGTDLVPVFVALEGADRKTYKQSQEQLKSIHDFLSDVTGETNIRLRVPKDSTEFEVVRNNTSEALSSLGSGLPHLIMLAIEVTLRRHQIVCLEEPEAFLHPILQRKLIAFLKTTSNQYFISTHSSQFLDMDDVNVFHLEMKHNFTTVTHAKTSSAKFAICRDLGYRASDIVQANCVIWVEGPSELIYLRKWISEFDSDLREGIEYSIMFFGGSVGEWMSGDDPEDLERLVSLVSINRNSAFITDCDKADANSELSQKKQQVLNQIAGINGPKWVTKGREIENYVPFATREASLKKLRPRSEPGITDGDFEFGYPRDKSGKAVLQKTKLATEICQHATDWSVLDLWDRVDELVKFVRLANHLPTKQFHRAPR